VLWRRLADGYTVHYARVEMIFQNWSVSVFQAKQQ
jgi:hypothetical protein